MCSNSFRGVNDGVEDHEEKKLRAHAEKKHAPAWKKVAVVCPHPSPCSS